MKAEFVGPHHVNPHEGERLRDEAMARLRVKRRSLIVEAKRVALQLALEHHRISVDDVRPLITIPPGITGKYLGAVFRDLKDAGFLRSLGYQASSRKEAHARPIVCWELVSPDAARAWLDAHPPLAAN
jgi:hypothetical protein